MMKTRSDRLLFFVVAFFLPFFLFGTVGRIDKRTVNGIENGEEIEQPGDHGETCSQFKIEMQFLHDDGERRGHTGSVVGFDLRWSHKGTEGGFPGIGLHGLKACGNRGDSHTGLGDEIETPILTAPGIIDISGDTDIGTASVIATDEKHGGDTEKEQKRFGKSSLVIVSQTGNEPCEQSGEQRVFQIDFLNGLIFSDNIGSKKIGMVGHNHFPLHPERRKIYSAIAAYPLYGDFDGKYYKYYTLDIGASQQPPDWQGERMKNRLFSGTV